MRSLLRTSIVAVSIAIVVGTTFGAETNGPMSSGKPPKPSAPPQTAPAVDTKDADFDVQKLFANTCGWCHSGGGRTAGKGPKLMDTTLTDAEIIHRIEVGKTGAMPAFGGTFNEGELRAIVKYIRGLREDGPTK